MDIRQQLEKYANSGQFSKLSSGNGQGAGNIGFIGGAQYNAEQSLVERTVSRMSDAISALEKETQMHIDRLSPVLIAEAAERLGEKEVSVGQDLGPLGNRLFTLASQIESLQKQLCSLRYRLTI